MNRQENSPKIFANSVPKSGTNLLIQILLAIPGISKFPKGYFGGIYNYNFSQLIKLENGQMAYGHVNYTPERADIIDTLGIKHIFISRDLRDVIVSYAHFIMDKNHEHELYDYFSNTLQSHSDRLMVLIEGTNLSYGKYPSTYELFRPIYDWRNTPNTCSVRFEDLMLDNTTKRKTLYKIVQFLWEDLQYLGLSQQEVVENMIRNINPEASFTFRKGKIGSWKEEFTEAHKEAFKKVAGKFLIELGYEKDYDW
ncbi:sulfotransferase domain-containing protein [Bacillus sp. OTU530]|jgi:hypothetical protein|uniref:sulfotransferase domain-containing protein n=1 Tax=Bacillus sp. OTU530 TaxID=3043862 RepID=UPI00313DCECA